MRNSHARFPSEERPHAHTRAHPAACSTADSTTARRSSECAFLVFSRSTRRVPHWRWWWWCVVAATDVRGEPRRWLRVVTCWSHVSCYIIIVIIVIYYNYYYASCGLVAVRSRRVAFILLRVRHREAPTCGAFSPVLRRAETWLCRFRCRALGWAVVQEEKKARAFRGGRPARAWR